MTLRPGGQKIVPPSTSPAATVRPPGCTVIALSADGPAGPCGPWRPCGPGAPWAPRGPCGPATEPLKSARVKDLFLTSFPVSDEFFTCAPVICDAATAPPADES